MIRVRVESDRSWPSPAVSSAAWRVVWGKVPGGEPAQQLGAVVDPDGVVPRRTIERDRRLETAGGEVQQ
jgi:hypothetical protein